MAYLLQSDLEGRVPADVVIEALDDDRDGTADAGVFAKVVSDVEQAINGRLEGRFTVPLADPLPYVVREAAIVLGCEALYLRRGRAGEGNPFSKQAEALRARLDRIGRGEEPLKYNETPAATGGTAITEDAKTYAASGELMV